MRLQTGGIKTDAETTATAARTTSCLERIEAIQCPKKRRPILRWTADIPNKQFLVHVATAVRHRGFLLLFGDLRDEGFGSQQEACNGGCVLQGSARDLGGIDHTSRYQVFEVACLCI